MQKHFPFYSYLWEFNFNKGFVFLHFFVCMGKWVNSNIYKQ